MSLYDKPKSVLDHGGDSDSAISHSIAGHHDVHAEAADMHNAAAPPVRAEFSMREDGVHPRHMYSPHYDDSPERNEALARLTPEVPVEVVPVEVVPAAKLEGE